MQPRPTFAALLKQFRVAAGLTHEALAERAGLGARTISDLERGVSKAPRPDTLALLVEALRLTPEQQTRLETSAREVALSLRESDKVSAALSHLPVQLTSFVGRSTEARAVRALLGRPDTRLVTLTGPGGVGKTRLSIHVAGQMGDAFADGVLVVPLAAATVADDVLRAIGHAILGPDTQPPPLPGLLDAIGQRELLLVLDNFEHLMAAAPLVGELLRGGPRLTVLTTSRSPLRVSGEQEFPLSPLPVPDLDRLPEVETLSDYAAVALFTDRASRVQPGFTLTSENATAVASICARLDGLPLALELAAARVKAFPPQLLLQRLSETGTGASLRLLTGGARDVPMRQQTLRDAIQWSYDLLTEDERVLFRRLAVFTGGCGIEAAETICGPAAVGPGVDVLEGVPSLIDKSLVYREDVPAGDGSHIPRFRMLETIHEYAREQLSASGEEMELRKRHAEFYLKLVEATGPLLFADRPKRMRLAREQANIHTALHWLVRYG